MKNRGRRIRAGTGALLTALLVVLVRRVDVAPIGPEGTRVGLSHLNRFVFGLFGVHLPWYDVTDWLGAAAILTACLFAAAGLVQMIRRRSLLRVDRELLCLGGLYLSVIGLYILFEKAVVNYRPIVMPGAAHPEASFPSSHTMLVCVVMGSAMTMAGIYVKGKTLRRAARGICAAVIGITVAGRLVSGVHWFTDILGGLLISAVLLELFAGAVSGRRECPAGKEKEEGKQSDE